MRNITRAAAVAAVAATALLGSSAAASASSRPEQIRLACTTTYAHLEGTIDGRTRIDTYETQECTPGSVGRLDVTVTVSGGRVGAVWLDDALFPFTPRSGSFTEKAVYTAVRTMAPCAQLIYQGDVPFSSMPRITQSVMLR